MDCKVELIDYHQTGYFSKIVTDYISQNNFLGNFYQHPVSLEGIKNAIAARKNINTDRKLLVEQLKLQYNGINTSGKAEQNLNALLNENTFTICTAHQPNIFSGHLYFIYKILHVIKLADHLNTEIKEKHFVPVFYMGSEDADIDELGHIFIRGDKYEWDTKQTGAVGRMKVDDALLKIIDDISGQLLPGPFGSEVIELIKASYVKDSTIERSTFKLVDALFSTYGLIVLLPDNASLKKSMTNIFEDDIFNNLPSEIVSRSSGRLSAEYKVQAHPREINLFYLLDNKRDRIIESKNIYRVNDTGISFTKDELKEELQNHPERFSPNVILRGLYQETILPNIAFVGGGGEIAYWLELKDLFEYYKIPYPLLIIRNSFLIVEKKVSSLIEKVHLSVNDFFKPEAVLINAFIKAHSSHQLDLDKEKEKVVGIYDEIKVLVKQIDPTLEANADALKARVLKNLDTLEKKMLKAEKRKFESQQRQIKKIRSLLFPNNELQERVENFMPFYAEWGKSFIDVIYQHSSILEQEFAVISEK